MPDMTDEPQREEAADRDEAADARADVVSAALHSVRAHRDLARLTQVATDAARAVERAAEIKRDASHALSRAINRLASLECEL